MNGFIRRSGIALALGAALTILLNVIFTPMLLGDSSEAAMRMSTPYLLRLSTALVSTLLLLFGSLGPHLAHRDRAGMLGAVAFGVLFIGTALMVGVEWSNVFVMRPLAQVSPAALEPLGSVTLKRMGSIAALSLFTLGWLLMSVSLFRTRAVSRWIPTATIVGLVSMPVLGVALGVTGQLTGIAIFGLGLFGLGWELARGHRVE